MCEFSNQFALYVQTVKTVCKIMFPEGMLTENHQFGAETPTVHLSTPFFLNRRNDFTPVFYLKTTLVNE